MRLEEVFWEAIERTNAQERAAYLEQICGQDRELLAQVKELIEAHEQSDGFLEHALLDADPTLQAAFVEAHGKVPGGVDDCVAADGQRERTLAWGKGGIAETSGVKIGPYKLLHGIGEGGFGVVFMAEQQQPVLRKVALKILKPGMDTKSVIARFEAERQALAMMDHQNIARVFDGGVTESGRPYFVMELVRGMPITEYCDRHDLATDQRLSLFRAVCAAIQHAHQKGIIHRDIKPSNVLVTREDGEPVVKVIDFGVAKAIHHRLTDKTLVTNFRYMLGTPRYMSPEQADPNGHGVDTRTDIYSLGVMLYELLTGTTPFDRRRLSRATHEEIRRIIREEEPIRPSSRLSTLGDSVSEVCARRGTERRRLEKLIQGDLDWIVMQALEKDRNRRYETAKDFAGDIDRYLRDQPVMAGPPSLVYRARKFARRQKGWVAFGATALTALLITSVVTWWSINRIRDARDAAIVAQRHAEREGGRARRLAGEATEAAENAQLALEMLGKTATELNGSEQSVSDMLNLLVVHLDGKDRPNHKVELNLRRLIADAYETRREFGKALFQYERCMELLREIEGQDSMMVSWWLTRVSLAAQVVGNAGRAEASAREAIAIAGGLGDDVPPFLMPQARHRLGQALRSRGELGEARRVLSEAVEMMANNPDRGMEYCWCLACLAASEGSLGNSKDEIALLCEAVAVAEAVGSEQGQSDMWILLGKAYAEQGRVADAFAALDRANALAKREAKRRVRRHLALTHARLRDYRSAVQLLEENIEQTLGNGGKFDADHLNDRSLLERLLAERGDDEQARRMGRAMVETLEPIVRDETIFVVTPRVDRLMLAEAWMVADPKQVEAANRAEQLIETTVDETTLSARQRTRYDLVRSAIASGRGDSNEAKRYARAAWQRELRSEAFGYDACARRYLQVLHALGEAKLIEDVLCKGLSKRITRQGDDSVEVAYARSELAEFLAGEGRVEEAQRLAAEALCVVEASEMVPEHVTATMRQQASQLHNVRAISKTRGHRPARSTRETSPVHAQMTVDFGDGRADGGSSR